LNRILFNYACQVQLFPKSRQFVVDGKTFFGMIDQGLWTYRAARIQLVGVDLPDTRPKAQGKPDKDAVEKFNRASQCLALALWGPQALLPPEEIDWTKVYGPRIIVSPLRPNEFGRVVARAYLQVVRLNVLYQNLCHSVTGFKFLDLGAFVNYLSNYGWSLDKAREIYADFQPIDCTLG